MKELIFVAVLVILSMPLLYGCATVTPADMKSAENVCAHHGGFKGYYVKTVMKPDALCGDGTIITNWPSK